MWQRLVYCDQLSVSLGEAFLVSHGTVKVARVKAYELTRWPKREGDLKKAGLQLSTTSPAAHRA